MSLSGVSAENQILAIDIGATNIKFCLVDSYGERLENPHRRPTPYPCSPARLVEVLVERISQTACERIGIGFPGEFADGCVVRPGNLSRPGGVATEVDPELDKQWRGFALQEVMREVTGRDVRIVNDARLAALGSIEGDGVELVLTLGTGLGLSLAINGVIQKVRDVGQEAFEPDRTYDQTLGETARSHDEERWSYLLVQVVDRFVEEFGANRVYLAGGNARRVSPYLFERVDYRVSISGNEAPLRGAAKLFYS
jgi:polyphosphate glucokinase